MAEAALWITVGVVIGTLVMCAITKLVVVLFGGEHEADFFEPIQYPTMDQVNARKAAREYNEQTTAEY